ncbi:MAG: hypothetical protein JWP11_1309 [Frankiales bacterium]|nr:hypothetical protein [Frankiales bacterium]
MTSPTPPSVLEVISAALRAGLDAQDANEGHGSDEGLAQLVVDALESLQPEHFLTFQEDGWQMQHSMACRLQGQLLSCATHQAAKDLVDSLGPRGAAAQAGLSYVVALTREDETLLELVERRCRECGCTESQACLGGCWWTADPGICTRCAA